MSTNTWFTRTVFLMLCVSAGILLRLSWGGSNNRPSTRGLLIADTKEPASTNATGDTYPRQDESQTDIVIVLAYYRSGSTFLAEIFNQNAEAVYFFEPLRWFRESFFNETFYIYPGNTRR
ncbi:uncharacterized protein LOC106164196 [Lingula anatina]|nr:uncharacterized protein LOC106164196 [Lingula anatina]|eukprot:XP_013397464.1 uncharacterized protein LOC106164196 [Lingula anatina]